MKEKFVIFSDDIGVHSYHDSQSYAESLAQDLTEKSDNCYGVAKMLVSYKRCEQITYSIEQVVYDDKS